MVAAGRRHGGHHRGGPPGGAGPRRRQGAAGLSPRRRRWPSCLLACAVGAPVGALTHLAGHALCWSARFLGAGDTIRHQVTRRRWLPAPTSLHLGAAAAIGGAAGGGVGGAQRLGGRAYCSSAGSSASPSWRWPRRPPAPSPVGGRAVSRPSCLTAVGRWRWPSGSPSLADRLVGPAVFHGDAFVDPAPGPADPRRPRRRDRPAAAHPRRSGLAGRRHAGGGPRSGAGRGVGRVGPGARRGPTGSAGLAPSCGSEPCVGAGPRGGHGERRGWGDRESAVTTEDATAAVDTTAEPRARLRVEIANAARIVAPVWPLERFVAVNPLVGLIEEGFDGAVADARRWLGARGYPGVPAPSHRGPHRPRRRHPRRRRRRDRARRPLGALLVDPHGPVAGTDGPLRGLAPRWPATTGRSGASSAAT